MCPISPRPTLRVRSVFISDVHLGFRGCRAAFLKPKVKNAVQYISNFERAVPCEVRHRGVDDVICGHIRLPEVGDISGVLYSNGGDWVENCTALVEDPTGRLSLLRWTEAADVVAGDATFPLIDLREVS